MSHETNYESTETETSGRHQINVGQLVMGIAFLGLVGVWAAIQGDLIEGRDIRWLMPMPWVLAGAAGLLAIALGGRRRTAAAEQAAYQPYAAPYSTPYGEDTDVLHTEPGTEPDTDENKENDR